MTDKLLPCREAFEKWAKENRYNLSNGGYNEAAWQGWFMGWKTGLQVNYPEFEGIKNHSGDSNDMVDKRLRDALEWIAHDPCPDIPYSEIAKQALATDKTERMMIPCGCGNITCPYCNPVPANMHNPQRGYYGFTPDQGWQCPVCKAVYAPITPGCFNCNRRKVTITEQEK